MTVQDPVSLAADLLGFAAALGKTVYDLAINPSQFKKESATLNDILEAARRKRERADLSTAVAFGLLVVSYTLFILVDVRKP